MKRFYRASLGLVCAGFLSLLARSEGRTPTAQRALLKTTPTANTGGIRWLTSFEKAKQQALREKKPVLLFQLFGKLDEALC